MRGTPLFAVPAGERLCRTGGLGAETTSGLGFVFYNQNTLHVDLSKSGKTAWQVEEKMPGGEIIIEEGEPQISFHLLGTRVFTKKSDTPG